MRVSLHFAASAVAFVLAGPAFAQTASTPPVGPDFSKITVATTALGDGIYMLEGAGGNVTVAAGADGVIMVDGQFAPMHDKLKAAIAAVTPQPVRYLINTHLHGDHTGGNAAFTADGATVIAHENVRKRLAEGSTSVTTLTAVAPVTGRALPVITYSDKLTIELRGRKAELTHPLNAHTDGDTYVWFADANVLATGDTFVNGRYSTIDYLNGGNIKGIIAACDIYLALANDKTRIVPGHGPLATRAQLNDYRTMLVTARDRMDALIRAGKSEQEIYDAKPFADLDGKFLLNEQNGKNFLRMVYFSMKP